MCVTLVAAHTNVVDNQPLRTLLAGFRYTPEMFDAITSEHNDRWNAKQGIRNLGEPYHGSYDYEKLEVLQEVASRVWDAPIFPGLRSTRDVFKDQREPKFGVAEQLLVRANNHATE